MRFYNITIATFLLGICACSSESGSRTDKVSSESQAVTASSADPSLASFPVAVSSAAASTPPVAKSYATHASAASDSLSTLRELVAKNPQLRGFQSAAEADGAALALALPVYMVGINDLLAFRKGDNPNGLLFDKKEVMYPITVNGDVRSSVIVRQSDDGTWGVAIFGRGPVAKAAHEGRSALAAKRGTAQSDVSLIEIPMLGVRLLGNSEKGALMLTALQDIPGTELRAGDTRAANDVFAVLHTLAENVDPNTNN